MAEGFRAPIRIATAADVEAMHRIRKQVRENRLSARTEITTAAYAPFVAAGSIWIAETTDRASGFGAIDFGRASIWALFVDPRDEGRGIGRALHATMIDAARGHGLKQLSLSTQASSRAAEFYLRAGWLLVRTERGEAYFEKALI